MSGPSIEWPGPVEPTPLPPPPEPEDRDQEPPVDDLSTHLMCTDLALRLRAEHGNWRWT